MDKLSVKVLKYIKKRNSPVKRSEIVAKFGENSIRSLEYLKKNDYIKDGKVVSGVVSNGGKLAPHYTSNFIYDITSSGLDFLESKPGRDFDRWLDRANIIFPMVGGALLSKPLWDLIGWVKDWLLQALERVIG